MSRYDSESKLPALKTLGRAELARGKRAEAREALESALHEKSDDVETLLLLARIWRTDNPLCPKGTDKGTDKIVCPPLDTARTMLERAQTLEPKNNLITFERMLLAKASNDLAAERSTLEELTARDPQRAAAL